MGKSLHCPGFRFKPTDVELAMFYLKKKLLGKKLDPKVIADINVYDFSPWDLPAKSILSGDLEWYFFCAQSKKYSSGPRMNRTTETGYWKGTGKDREVKYKERTVATIKTLVFHMGQPPKGTRTNWVMHEYRMKDDDLANKGVPQEAFVICKVFEKSGIGPKNAAQYGAPFEEEEWDDNETSTVTSSEVVSLLVNPNNASCSGVKNMTSIEPGPSMVGLSGATKTLDSNASGSTPSTITSVENERHIEHPSNHDDMLTDDDIALLLQYNNTEEVGDGKEKKAITDDGIDIFQELAAISNLNDLIDGSPDDDYLDKFLTDDDYLDKFLPDDDFLKLLD